MLVNTASGAMGVHVLPCTIESLPYAGFATAAGNGYSSNHLLAEAGIAQDGSIRADPANVRTHHAHLYWTSRGNWIYW